jgi:hypothetical protein
MNAGREGVEARANGQSLFAEGIQAGFADGQSIGLNPYPGRGALIGTAPRARV